VLAGSLESKNAMTADEILTDLRKYDFPHAYHTRLAVFGTPETDEAAVLAARTPAASLGTAEDVRDFLHRIWGLTSTALDRSEHHAGHKPVLVQLELELANLVTALRDQPVKRS
jgi:hypothetical protein